jgi:hypothetical protein
LNGARSGPGDLDDAVKRRRERHLANDRGDLVCREGWNRPGESLTMFPSALEAAMPLRNSRNWVERMIVYGMPEVSISFLGDLGAEIAIVGRPVGADER